MPAYCTYPRSRLAPVQLAAAILFFSLPTVVTAESPQPITHLSSVKTICAGSDGFFKNHESDEALFRLSDAFASKFFKAFRTRVEVLSRVRFHAEDRDAPNTDRSKICDAYQNGLVEITKLGANVFRIGVHINVNRYERPEDGFLNEAEKERHLSLWHDDIRPSFTLDQLNDSAQQYGILSARSFAAATKVR